MNQTVAAILQEFSLDSYRPIVPRALDLGEPLPPRAGNLVKVVVGMRRSGKSYRLFQEMDELLNRGVSPQRICYFNFEDDRVAPVTSQTGDEVIEAFRYLYQPDEREGLYLFFDELQEMEGWGSWLRRIVDTTRATIYVSGSSSKMLSSEIATEFRGRALEFELLPYSYRELVQADAALVDALTDRVPSPRRRVHLQVLLDRYLERGGFPAVQSLEKPQAISLLQSYVQRVVTRDVVERHNIGRPRLASALARRLMGLNARELSVRKVENDLRSAGLGSGRGYLADLISYFEEAYLLFQVREYSHSLAESTTAMPKLYVIDPGLALANSRAGACERGQRLEDAVYLELRRRCLLHREGTISTYRTKTHGYEVDFVVGDVLDGAPYQAMQVCESMDNPATVTRETRALWELLDESEIDEGLLIVGTGDETVYEQDGKRILQIPAWKWLLGSSEVEELA